jgi:bifunctional UDP-N-acetylglucosamine pyrophosphorylase/glucosamine-1-phosphate N-acetyltransferase
VYIWKNTIIWPNTYIRWNTVIWDNCKIWNAVEVKNTSIWNDTHIAHLSYIWDSVIWNNINIGWWFITANLRHDKENIRIPVKWELIDSWLCKFWVIIWDNSKIWIKCYSMPGRVIENDSAVNPGSMIK